MHNTDRLDLVLFVLGQIGLDLIRVGAAAPITFDEFGLHPQLFSQLFPQGREMPGFEHQHAVAGRQGVDQCGLPRAGARGGIDEHALVGFEDRLHPVQRLHSNLGKIRATVVDGLLPNRAKDTIWNRTWPRNLQEVTPGFSHEIGSRNSAGNDVCDGARRFSVDQS